MTTTYIGNVRLCQQLKALFLYFMRHFFSKWGFCWYYITDTVRFYIRYVSLHAELVVYG